MNEIFLPLIFTSTAKQDSASLMIFNICNHKDQQRDKLNREQNLCLSAQYKAEQLSKLTEWQHVLKDGIWPNKLVRNYCSNLDPTYSDNNNYVESILIGIQDREIALYNLLKSEGHANHVLGRVSFYREQNSIGVGYVEANNNYFWVIHLAKLI